MYRRKGVHIYQNENAFPHAFVIYNIINVDDFQSAMDQMQTPFFDPRKAAVVENFPAELSTLINKHGQPIPFTTGEAKFVNSGQVDVTVEAEAPGLLVVSDQYYPGWAAYVDGEPAPIYAVNGILRGVYLEEGRHVIQFKYRPRSFMVGAIISILLFLFVIIMLVVSRRRNDIVTETRNTFKPMELTTMKCTICGQEGATKEFSFEKYPVYSCANCGFRWLHPQPTDAELAEIYSDQCFLDEGDAKITEIVNQFKSAQLPVCTLNISSGENHHPLAQLALLEIGCGMGDFLLSTIAAFFKVSGLEVTDHLVELANRRLGQTASRKVLLKTQNLRIKRLM